MGLMSVGSTFHSQGANEMDALEDSDVYLDLGDDPPEDLDFALKGSVKQAKENGLCTRERD